MKNKPDVATVISEINKIKGHRKGCQGLSSSLASDGYIRSIVNWTKVTSPDRIDALVEYIEELQRKYEELVITSATVISELQGKVEALAVENGRLSSAAECLLNEASEVYRAYNKTQLPDGDLVDGQSLQEVYDAINATPATDSYLAEIRAQSRAEGINFAASRLAAAFNHGFIEKPMSEVFDVVRMILTAKEDINKSPAPDGLSGEYAESALKQWEEQLRKESGQ